MEINENQDSLMDNLLTQHSLRKQKVGKTKQEKLNKKLETRNTKQEIIPKQEIEPPTFVL